MRTANINRTDSPILPMWWYLRAIFLYRAVIGVQIFAPNLAAAPN